MPLPKISPNEHTQQSLQLEKHLVSLKREYHVLEKDAACIKTHPETQLAKLTKIYTMEYDDVLTSVIRVENTGWKHSDEILYDNLDSVIKKNHGNKHKILTLKAYLKELENEIKTVQKQVESLRKQQVTDRQHEERVKNAFKTVAALENRLETQNIQFGVHCCKNLELRTELSHLLWDRRNFLSQWDKLIEKLNMGKKIMIDLIEQATLAFNQREEWFKKLQLLRLTGAQDGVRNTDKIRELERKQYGQEKIIEFLEVKGQRRLMYDLREKRQYQRMEFEKHLDDTLLKYNVMVSVIKSFTKEQNVQRIASNFAAQEQVNISNFKYVIEQIKESEYLNEKLGAARLDIDYKHSLNETRRLEQQVTIKKLTNTKDEVRSNRHTIETEVTTLEQQLQYLYRGIKDIFTICKCDEDPLLKLLGNHSDVEFYNTDFYLQLLEEKLQKILLLNCFKDSVKYTSKKGKQKAGIINGCTKLYTLESIVKATPCPLCIIRQVMVVAIDTSYKPLAREKAKEKLAHRLALPETPAQIHTISKCLLPQARRIMQKRYE